MSSKVFISGYGIISALGVNAKENLRAIKNQSTGIKTPKILNTRKSFVLGEVDRSNTELSDLCNLKSVSSKSRTTLLGIIAIKEALKMADLDEDATKLAGFVNGTSVGGMDLSESAYMDLLDGKPVNFKKSFSEHDCGASTHNIANELNINGYLSTISTACSSSANSIMHAAQLIKAGSIDCVIAGGSDALTNFTLNGFDSLKILDSQWCKPFDRDRMGLNLGEGAAYLILESEEHLKKRNGKGLAELVGYGNANDAYHQTASSPEGKGALMAIETAMQKAKLKPEQISYINAHGTGTGNNDNSESIAIKSVFKSSIPPYSSTKSYTGHTLAAAGGIEAVLSIMAIQEQMVWPNLNLQNPMEIMAPPLGECKSLNVERVLSNSFGFGGNCSSLIFSKI